MKKAQENTEDGVDIVAQIEKTKQAAIRGNIVESVMERLQRNYPHSAAGLNMA